MIDHSTLLPERAESDLLQHLEMPLQLLKQELIDLYRSEIDTDQVIMHHHGENVQLLQELIAS